MSAPVLAATKWATNAHMIEAVAQLGYLRREWVTLDPTYGLGVFWQRWKPECLIGNDLALNGIDFRAQPYPDWSFDAVVFDPPYKLNGTPTPLIDARYGVDVPARWQDRMQLCRDGIVECARIADKVLLVKCQDQVVSGEVRWQTREFADVAEANGMRMVDRLDFLAYRPQPNGRSQQHARRNYSTLLIFERKMRDQEREETQ